MTTITGLSAGRSDPDHSPRQPEGQGHWYGTAFNYLGTAVTVVTAITWQHPYALLVPTLMLIMALAALWRWRRSNEGWRRQHSSLFPAALVTVLVSTAAIASLQAYAMGNEKQDGEMGRNLAALAKDKDQLSIEVAGLNEENASLRRDKGELQKENQGLVKENDELKAGELSAEPGVPSSPQPSPTPPAVASASPSPVPGGDAQPYRLELTSGSYYDFDARKASQEASQDFEVQYSSGRLFFGGSGNSWQQAQIVYIPTVEASAAGCERGTKLQHKVAHLTNLEQDESICVSTSEGRWAVLKHLPSNEVSHYDSFDVRVF